MSLFNKNDDQKVTWDSINDLITLEDDDVKDVLNEINGIKGLRKLKHLTLRSKLFKRLILGLLFFLGIACLFVFNYESLKANGSLVLADSLGKTYLIFLCLSLLFWVKSVFKYMTFEDLNKQSIQAKSIEWLFKVCKQQYDGDWFRNLDNIIDSCKGDFLNEQDQHIVDECKRLAGVTKSNKDEDLVVKFIRAIIPLRILTSKSKMVDQYSYDRVMNQYGVRSRLTELVGELNHRFEQQEKDKSLQYEEALKSAIQVNDEIFNKMDTALNDKERNDALLEESSEFKRMRDVAAKTKTAAIKMNETVSYIDNKTGKSEINHRGTVRWYN